MVYSGTGHHAPGSGPAYRHSRFNFYLTFINIREDPTEQNNIALKNLKMVKAMKDRATELAATKFATDSDMSLKADCERAIVANNGTYGPWLDLELLA